MSENQLTEIPKLIDQDSTVWATSKLRELSNRVNAGDRLALQELRDTLDKYTWMSSVMGGNLAYQAETSLVNATVRRLTLPIRVDVNLATMVNTNLR